MVSVVSPGRTGTAAWARIGPEIHLGADKVHGAAGDQSAVVEDLLVGVETRKGREKGRVDVHQAVAPAVDKAASQQAHEAREANQFYAVIEKRLMQTRLEGHAVGVFAVVDGDGRNALFLGPGEPQSLRSVGDHDGRFGGEIRCAHCGDEGLHIGAPSGNQNGCTFSRHGAWS